MTEQHPGMHVRIWTGRSNQGVGHVDESHDERSLTVIGLAVHIQSLCSGTRVATKLLAAEFPGGEKRIASALRELKTHGYLARTRSTVANHFRPQFLSHLRPSRRIPRAFPTRRSACDVLAGLRTHASRLHLTEHDVHILVPAVVTWLERGRCRDCHSARQARVGA